MMTLLQRRVARWLILLAPALLLLLTAAARAQDAPPITYERYDTTIEVQPDGALLITEHQEVRFGDEFRTAFAEIPLDYTASIEVLSLAIDGQQAAETSYRYETPGTYSTSQDGRNVSVEWYYEPTAPGDLRTFDLTYLVRGGLWVYDEEQVMEWRAVPSDRSGVPVSASRVTVILPESPSPDAIQYTAYGPSYEARIEGRKLIYQATQPLPDGLAFQVQVGFPPAMTSATRQPWQESEESAPLRVSFPAFRAEMWINPDGTVTMEESQTVRVEQGILTGGRCTISQAYLDEIRDVQLWEGDRALESGSFCTYCFESRSEHHDWIRYDRRARQVRVEPEQAGSTIVEWVVPDLVRGEEAIYRLRYTVVGLVVPQRDGSQTFTWRVVPNELRPAPAQASLLIHLPEGVAAERVQLTGGRRTQQPDGSLLVEPDVPLGNRSDWPVTVVLPPAATTATAPDWQQVLLAAEAEARAAVQRRAQVQLGAGVGGLILLVLGIVGVGMGWYLRGREHPQPLIADLLSEPPSDLPPAIVTYLLDESPSSRGVLASLFQLGTLGLLTLRQGGRLGLTRNSTRTTLDDDTAIQQADGKARVVPPHLIRLYNGIADAIPYNDTISLDSISGRFQGVLPTVYRVMANEVQPYFDELPEAARRRWLSLGQWLMIAAALLTLCAALFLRREYGWVVVAPPIALAGIGLALAVVSRWMPRRTIRGADEAMRWRAFRRYLESLQGYRSLEEARRMIDLYFPYAVAFGLEEQVLQQAEAAGAQSPSWSQGGSLTPLSKSENPRRPGEPYRTVLRREPSYPLDTGTSPTTSAIPGTDESATKSEQAIAQPLPKSMQGWSNRIARTISQSDRDLASLLTQAATASQVGDTPFESIADGATSAGRGTLELLDAILESSFSDSGGSSGSGSHGSWSSSSRSSRSHSSSSSSRSSSSRRSGGGGSRGFG